MANRDYQTIEENYYGKKPRNLTMYGEAVSSDTPCGCEQNCGSGIEVCRNIIMNIECGNSCGFQDNCGNKNFQFKRYAKLAVLETPLKGLGVFAKEDIAKDQFIIEYVGEFIGKKPLQQRLAKYKQLKKDHYVLACKRNYIDATVMGNIARFVNHSCQPNCRIEFWEVFRKTCVGIFAECDIKEGEEITYDYKFESYDEKLIQCYCFTDKCSGLIGKRKGAANNTVGSSNSNEDITDEEQQVDQRLNVDGIERGDANIEETKTEGLDFSVEPNEVDDQTGLKSTSKEPESIELEQDVEHEERRENEASNSEVVQRASKRGRPLKKNAHKRLNVDIDKMKGRRSKNDLRTLKLRFRRLNN